MNYLQGSPWKSLEKAMSNLRKESSVEDLLREQIQKQEFYDGGSGGENTGGGGDSGSGGDDGSSPGESDDDMSLLGRIDEFFQVILAFTGFVIAVISLSMILTLENLNQLRKMYSCSSFVFIDLLLFQVICYG